MLSPAFFADYGQDKDKQDKLSAWLKKHPVKDEGVHKQLDSLFEALHNQYSISKLFVEGFCWGGNYALELAATDKVRLCSTLMTLSLTAHGPHPLSRMWLTAASWSSP